jgi:integrase
VKAAKQERAANSFEVVAREWYGKSPQLGRTPRRPHHPALRARYFPVDWRATDCRRDRARTAGRAVRRIENRGALETAHRALGNCGQVFRYAIATGRALRDPSGDLRGALPPVKGEHFAAVTNRNRRRNCLRTLDGYQGTLTVACALRLAPLVFVRPGELRKAEWADIDLDAAEWRYHVTKTDSRTYRPSGNPSGSDPARASCPDRHRALMSFRAREATGDR